MFATNVGDYLVIQITGCIPDYIAEVTKSEPLQLKVEETGLYTCLKDGDFIVNELDSEAVQEDEKNDTCEYLQSRKDKGWKPCLSGLKSLGMPQDGRLYEVLPDQGKAETGWL